MAMGQFYHVAVCTKRRTGSTAVLQDNGTWGGPSIGLHGGVGAVNEDWLSIFGGDGYQCAIDRSDPDLIYYECRTAAWAAAISRPANKPRSVPRASARRQGHGQGQGRTQHRFNWNTPFILSHHNPKIFYCGGDFVFKSLDRGNDLKIISPELTLTKRGTASAIAESAKEPRRPVGRHRRRRSLGNTQRRQGLDQPHGQGRPARPALGRHHRGVAQGRGRAYVAFDAHRSDDDKPYLFVTEDFGETWKSITAPARGRFDRCLREDIENLICSTAAPSSVSLRRSIAANRGRASTTICPPWLSTKSPCIPPPAKSSLPRTAAACGFSTCRPCGRSSRRRSWRKPTSTSRTRWCAGCWSPRMQDQSPFRRRKPEARCSNLLLADRGGEKGDLRGQGISRARSSANGPRASSRA